MMKKKVWSSIAAAAVIFGGAYGISEVQGASAGAAAQSSSKSVISIGKAEAAALKAAPGRVDSIDLEEKLSGVYYDVDIQQQKQEVDVRVDAYTGKVLSVRKETDDDDDDSITAAAQEGTLITAGKAAEAAAASVKGKVTEIDFDRENGTYVYEVEIRNGSLSTEVRVDAYTAKILNTDEEWDDDDDDD